MISTLRSLAVAADGDVSCPHPVWGAMSLDDWHAWAYKHHDHHLRQFGL